MASPQAEKFSLLPANADFGAYLDNELHKQSQLTKQDSDDLARRRTSSSLADSSAAVSGLPNVMVKPWEAPLPSIPNSPADRKAENSSKIAVDPGARVEQPSVTNTKGLDGKGTDGKVIDPNAAEAKAKDNNAGQQNDKFKLPKLDIDAEFKPAPDHDKHERSFKSLALDLAVGAGAAVAVTAIAAISLKNPKAGLMAFESFAKVATPIIENGQGALLKGALISGTMGGATVLRHYGYEALTGDKESWGESSHGVASTVGTILFAKRAGSWLDAKMTARKLEIPAKLVAN